MTVVAVHVVCLYWNHKRVFWITEYLLYWAKNRDAAGHKQAPRSTLKCPCSTSTHLSVVIAYVTVLMVSSHSNIHSISSLCLGDELWITLHCAFLRPLLTTRVWLHESWCSICPVTRWQWLAGLLRPHRLVWSQYLSCRVLTWCK